MLVTIAVFAVFSLRLISALDAIARLRHRPTNQSEPGSAQGAVLNHTKQHSPPRRDGPTPALDEGPAVHVGDRRLTNASWSALQQALDCWTARGRWQKDPRGVDNATGLPRMYELGFTPNPRVFNNVFLACGLPHERTGLEYVWTPQATPEESSAHQPASPDTCLSRAPFRRAWSADLMCSLLRGRPVIFCGDGIQTSVYETFAAVLGAQGGGGCSEYGSGCHSTACGGRVQLRHLEVVHCLSSQV